MTSYIIHCLCQVHGERERECVWCNPAYLLTIQIGYERLMDSNKLAGGSIFDLVRIYLFLFFIIIKSFVLTISNSCLLFYEIKTTLLMNKNTF